MYVQFPVECYGHGYDNLYLALHIFALTLMLPYTLLSFLDMVARNLSILQQETF